MDGQTDIGTDRLFSENICLHLDYLNCPLFALLLQHFLPTSSNDFSQQDFGGSTLIVSIGSAC